MNKMVISTHDFQEALNHLQTFSQKSPDDLGLPSVRRDSGWFRQKVTVKAIDELTAQIQGHLIDLNELQCCFIKEFGHVYGALEALDKDYISAILISLKAAEEANRKAVKNQEDIGKTIDMQKQTIAVLVKFKEQLSKYDHIKDIDEVWAATKLFHKDIEQLKAQIVTLTQAGEARASSMKAMTKFKDRLSAFRHLDDIDDLWNDTQKLCESINTVQGTIAKIVQLNEAQAGAIEELRQFDDRLSTYEHLKDIDDMWNCAQELKRDVQNQESKIDSHQEQLQSLNLMLLEDKKAGNAKIEALVNKVKIAYYLAGGAVALSVIQLFVNMMGSL